MPRQGATWAKPAFPPDQPPARPEGVPVQSSGVLLGFADGSELALDAHDPSAVALRAVADALVARPRRR